MTNILFVCSANKDRSKTADDFFSTKHEHIAFESAGTNISLCQKEGTNPITAAMLEWADKVYVMERKHQQYILKNIGGKYLSKITVLDIPDYYKYYEPRLLKLLEERIVF